MKRLFQIISSLVVAVGIMANFFVQTALAEDLPPVESESGQVVSTVTMGKSVPSLYGVLPGPGTQKGTLSSILGWYGSYWIRGQSKITLQGSPTAKAWTTFSYTTPEGSGGQLETTSGNPCWTTTNCTSSTQYHMGFTKNTYLNFAETVVYWSDGTNSSANATATKTF